MTWFSELVSVSPSSLFLSVLCRLRHRLFNYLSEGLDLSLSLIIIIIGAVFVLMLPSVIIFDCSCCIVKRF